MMKRPPRQSKKPKEGREGLLERMRAANPAGAALLDKHRAKADLAMALPSAQGEGDDARRPSTRVGGSRSAVDAVGDQVELSFSFGPDDDHCSSRVTLS